MSTSLVAQGLGKVLAAVAVPAVVAVFQLHVALVDVAVVHRLVQAVCAKVGADVF